MKSSIRRATSLTTDELRVLWRLRLSLIDLKPSVTREQDFAAFARDFQWPGFVWILRREERVIGFALQRALPMTWRGRDVLCLLPEYGFLAPHVRGRPIVPLATAAITLLTLGRHALRPKYVASTTYPPGYITFRKFIRPFWTVRDPTLPAWERSLLEHLAERVAGEHFHPEDGTVTMRTIPRVQRDHDAAGSADSRRLYADYVAANPDWRQGRGLFFLFPVDARSFARIIGHAMQRWSRRRYSQGIRLGPDFLG